MPLRRLTKATFSMLPACCVALVCFVLSGCSRLPEDPPSASAVAAEATSRMEEVEVAGVYADGTVWRLLAAEGWGREGEVTGTLRQVRATLRKGEFDLTLRAERARAEGGAAFQFSDGVQVSWGPYAVHVAHASYEQDRGVVASDSPVEFTGPGLRLTGVGVEVVVANRVVRILHDARAVIGKEWQ